MATEGGGIRFDSAQIRELARILHETNLSEIELVEKDSRIRVVRQVTAAPATFVGAAPPPAAPGGSATPSVIGPSPPAPTQAVDAVHAGAVTSPMVGVAYLSPEPGAPTFVQIGSPVVQGQTLLLIEAMKTFNQIKSPRAGTVTRILIEHGAPVEYGEPLMVVE